MFEVNIGFFTAQAIETKWGAPAIVRDTHKVFRFGLVTPDPLAFSESSTVSSPFELPESDFIRKRPYSELKDGSYISIISDKEITPCIAVSMTVMTKNLTNSQKLTVESQLISLLRSQRIVFTNGTEFTFKSIFGQSLRMKMVTRLKTPQFYEIASTTKITISLTQDDEGYVSYPSINVIKDKLKKMICYSLYNDSKVPGFMTVLSAKKYNPHSKGIIVYGPDGSGRQTVIKNVANELKIPLSIIDGETFDATAIEHPQLSGKATGICLLKGFDSVFPIMGRRLTTQILSMVDRSTSAVFIMLANSDEDIPHEISSLSTFSHAIRIPPLSRPDMEAILNNKIPVDNALGATLTSILKVRQTGSLDDLVIEKKSQITATVAKTTWDDIGGLESTKKLIKEAVEWPLTRTADLKSFGVRPLKGILLYGPPGCGKTMIARAIASSLSSSFFAISAAATFHMYLGESERVVRELFELARQNSPSVVFIDEIDAIVGKRGMATGVTERVLSTFLNEMDGVSELSDVVVVAATNRRFALDDALCRPGRFDCLVEVKPCETEEDVRSIFKVCTRKMPLEEDVLETISKVIPLGSSGAEIDNLCREAAILALHDGLERISCACFVDAIKAHMKN